GVAVITVIRSGDSIGEATVDCATGPGTATPNFDFVPTIQTLSFQEGETNKDFLVPILDDFLLESNETVQIVLSNPTGTADVGQPTNAVLTILDDEIASSGTFQFTVTNFTVSEAGPTASITISRTGGAVGSVRVDFNTAQGTATPGLDYVELATNLTFAANETSKTVPIRIINDSIDEPNQ